MTDISLARRGRYPHVDIFTAQALPLGRDWTGLTYLHGAVERDRSHLIVTDRDFGQAYLADAWATRFLMTMFEAYVVLFVGYSHADPVMRYLARSFVGGTSRFALTLPDQDDHWTHLGIVPVHFPKRIAPDEYGALDDAIESWNAAARMGVFDHRLRIGQLVALPPPLEPENIDYLRGVVTDPVTLRFFVEPHSEAIGKLLADLLPHVTEVRHDTGELFDLAAGALAGGADRADVRQIAAEMLRLGLMDGERLRRIADEALDST